VFVLVKGKRSPRYWTRPLRPLTRATSYGYDVIDFAKEIGFPLDPWQEWTVIHIGELLEDGRPRFRKVLVLVSRQNGKTRLLKILTLYWLYKAPEQQQVERILGTSTTRDAAKDALEETIDLAVEADLDHLHWKTIGNEHMEVGRKEYGIAATNGRAARGKSIDRLIVDELREHNSWDAMQAAEPTMSARPFGQQFMISNQGDDSSIVLDSYRKEAITFIETGEGDERLGLFEYSAPDGSDPENLEALAQANPNMGHRLEPDDLLRLARSAKADPGRLNGFKTEHMCMRVDHLDPAINPEKWKLCAVKADPATWMAEMRGSVCLCVDLSRDGTHATLYAAAPEESGKIRIAIAKAWEGPDPTKQMRTELPALIKEIKPAKFGWFPSGGAAAVAADLTFADMPRLKVEPIRGDLTIACMGFSDSVTGEMIRHSDDALMNKQVSSATRHWNGDRWMFIRKGKVPVDAVYAAAGAVHLARTLPPPKPPLVIRQF
jgi:phage terminase large subunit-like protein